ncbi:MAG: hypothetical protein NTW25_14055 [Candidatus Kapabacteria bacterium]|nr:hypothetical protein [Candidatus Kapabacteria bacterium]
MNGAHIHMVLNHFPIIGTIIGFLVLVAGFFLKSSTIKRVGLGILIFTSIVGIPAFLSGDKAEDVIENIAGVNKHLIHEHEEIAEKFIWFIVLIGISSLVTLYLDLKEKTINIKLYYVVLALTFVSILISKNVGTTGGEIRHSEIRSSESQKISNEPNKDEKEKEEHENK